MELVTRNNQELWNIIVTLPELGIFRSTADGTSLVFVFGYIVLVLQRINIYRGEDFDITKNRNTDR